jgi:hypothetical protein
VYVAMIAVMSRDVKGCQGWRVFHKWNWYILILWHLWRLWLCLFSNSLMESAKQHLQNPKLAAFTSWPRSSRSCRNVRVNKNRQQLGTGF